MAKSDIETIPAGIVTELTDGDVTAITVINEGPGALRITGTTSSAPSTETAMKGLPLKVGEGFLNRSLAELFPDTAGADRVFAWSDIGTAVQVRHA